MADNSTFDSDDIHDLFLSGSATSIGRSSIGSIPWAEDAVKQNQLEWERVERAFYGEESLTLEETKLEKEILEWVTKFPHLRIIGKSLHPGNLDHNNQLIPIMDNLQLDSKSARNPNNQQESVLNQFSFNNNRKESFEQNKGNKSSQLMPPGGAIRNKCSYFFPKEVLLIRDSSAQRNNDSSIFSNISGPYSSRFPLERCLRITSGQLLSRRHYDERISDSIKPKAPKTATVLNNSRHSTHDLNIHLESTFSPRSLPPIITLNRAPTEIKTHRERKVIRSSLTLPSINVADDHFQNEVVGRAISALYPKKREF